MVRYWDMSSLWTREASSVREREIVAPGQSFPLIRNFSGHTVSLYNGIPLNVDSDFRRAVFPLLRSFPSTVSWLSLVQKMKACAYGTSALVFGS